MGRFLYVRIPRSIRGNELTRAEMEAAAEQLKYELLESGVRQDAIASIERFDAQRSAARRHVQERIEALARVRIEPRIPGRRYRNVHVTCLLERRKPGEIVNNARRMRAGTDISKDRAHAGF